MAWIESRRRGCSTATTAPVRGATEQTSDRPDESLGRVGLNVVRASGTSSLHSPMSGMSDATTGQAAAISESEPDVALRGPDRQRESGLPQVRLPSSEFDFMLRMNPDAKLSAR